MFGGKGGRGACTEISEFPSEGHTAYMVACGLEMASLSLVEAAHAGGTADKGNISSSSQKP